MKQVPTNSVLPRSRGHFEAALEEGRAWTQMTNGSWWRLRRNGQTRLWKRNQARFLIPVKAGMRACGHCTDRNLYNGAWRVVEEGANG